MKRKLLVSLLVLSMVLCLLPAGASADGIVGAQYNTVSAGYTHAAAIDSKGGLWTWGRNDAGQLGNGGVADIRKEQTGFEAIYQSTPVKIMDDVVSVSASKGCNFIDAENRSATAAIKSDRSLWVWGNARYIGTGGKGNTETTGDHGHAHEIQNVPIKLMDNVASVSMGGFYNFALKTDGTLYSWSAYYSHYPEGAYDGTPVKIMDNVTSVSAGRDVVAVIKNDNSLWMCYPVLPEEEYYNPDDNWTTYIRDPRKIEMEKVMEGVASVATGSISSQSGSASVLAAIKTDGSLWVLGAPDGVHRLSSPLKVMDKVLSVSAFTNIEAIKPDHSLWRFEFSYNGEPKGFLELTDPADWSFTTEKVMDGVSEVSVGPSLIPYDYTIVKKTDGSVWTWGSNGSYCVGNGGKGEVVKDKWGNEHIEQKTPVQIIAGGTTPPVDQPTVIETSGLKPQETGRAYENTQTILVDGKPVTFETYALHDAKGNPTNYIRIRDLAYTINGTKAQFEIAWDGDISLTTGTPYTPNGKEMTTPFSGDRDYKKGESIVTIDGKPYDIQCFVIYGNKGGGYTYYKLRDLGMALGFNVGWNAQDGVFIETDKPYTGK